jgi:AcrR family transcriptional regulator
MAKRPAPKAKPSLKASSPAAPAEPLGARAARKAAQPQNILTAALKVFGERGFAATRMEDVAKEAGITKGAIYLYFPSKQALLEALVRRDISPRIAMIRALLDAHQGPVEPLLRAVIGRVLGFLKEGVLPTYARLIVAEAGNFPDLARFHRTEVVDVVLSGLTGLFDRAMQRGEMRRMDPETAARLFVAPILKSILWRVVFGAIEDKPFDPAPYLDAHVSNFLRGMAPEPQP